MSFANLTAFWALLLAIPIVAVYLIRNRPSTRSVSTLLFWEQVSDEPKAAALFKRLRHPGSLILQLALLLLLTLALSEPSLHGKQGRSQSQVLVIDNSASMQAVDSNHVPRLELAITEAIALIDTMAPDSEVSVIASCPTPHVICPLTKSSALAKSRLNTIQQTDCVGRIEEAIHFARSAASRSAAGRLRSKPIVVVTDGNDNATVSTEASRTEVPRTDSLDGKNTTSSPTDDSPMTPEVRTIEVGTPVDNVGLTVFRVRRTSSDPTLWHLLYEVSNFSESNTTVHLEIQQDNTLLDVLPLNLKPGQSIRNVVTKTSAKGGLITGTLKTVSQSHDWADALAIDNQATSLLAARPMLDVTLVTSGNWFLQQALAAHPLVRLTVIKPSQQQAAAQLVNSIFVFDSTVPQTWLSQDSIPTKALVVAPSQSSRLWTFNGQIDTTFVGEYQQNHPLLKYVQLEDVAINSASDVSLVNEAKTIATALEGRPLLATYTANNSRVVMLAVNLNRSDLPLRSSFPILLTNTLQWLDESLPEILPQADTNSPTTIVNPATNSTPISTATCTVSDPSGQSQPVAVAHGSASLGRLSKVGVYTVQFKQKNSNTIAGSTSDQGRLQLPCNLVSRQESRLNQIQNGSVNSSAGVATPVAPSFNLQNLLLVMAMVAFIAECWLWHRRIIE